jgi:hypothetical protein
MSGTDRRGGVGAGLPAEGPRQPLALIFEEFPEFVKQNQLPLVIYGALRRWSRERFRGTSS